MNLIYDIRNFVLGTQLKIRFEPYFKFFIKLNLGSPSPKKHLSHAINISRYRSSKKILLGRQVISCVFQYGGPHAENYPKLYNNHNLSCLLQPDNVLTKKLTNIY